jgi:Rrf2 family transcriptional regulator, nitric oxide-sensitive transcriptional repressor
VFRINRRTDYAVRVMLCLAKRPYSSRLSTQTIQDEMLTPRAFLQRIIADLSKAELICTYPGPNGGVQLARQAAEINLRHIWEAIEGPLMISECIEAPQDCPLNAGCPVRSRWCKLQTIIARELEKISLEELATEALFLAIPGSLKSGLTQRSVELS